MTKPVADLDVFMGKPWANMGSFMGRKGSIEFNPRVSNSTRLNAIIRISQLSKGDKYQWIKNRKS